MKMEKNESIQFLENKIRANEAENVALRTAIAVLMGSGVPLSGRNAPTVSRSQVDNAKWGIKAITDWVKSSAFLDGKPKSTKQLFDLYVGASEATEDDFVR